MGRGSLKGTPARGRVEIRGKDGTVVYHIKKPMLCINIWLKIVSPESVSKLRTSGLMKIE